MIERFTGEENRRTTVDALKSQSLVQGDEGLANEIYDEVELLEIEKGAKFIKQGDFDDDLYFIIAGRVSICINDREVAIRLSRQHIGEMAVLDPGAARSASAVALEKTVVARLSANSFNSIASRRPRLWRLLAFCLADRLRERSRFVVQRNPRSVVFIGSSRESLPIANQLQDCLKGPDIVVKVWTDGVFGPSRFPIEDLENQIQASDFAILLLAPDDKVTSREMTTDAPRDNVIFELGLFMGALGHRRSFLVIPRGLDIKVPSDLFGLSPLYYSPNADDQHASIQTACSEIKIVIEQKGPK